MSRGPGLPVFSLARPGITLVHCQAVPGAISAVFQCHCFPKDPVLFRGQLSGSESFRKVGLCIPLSAPS